MKRTEAPNSAEGLYVDENPLEEIQGTLLWAADRNAIQEELIELIAAGGLTPNGGDLTQVRQAVQALVNSRAGINDIINGHFAIWQRGTSFAAAASGIYTADRFRYSKSGAMVHTVSRDSDVPGMSPYDVNYSLKLDCTTIDSSIAAAEYCGIFHLIEGFNFKKYAGNYGTISFWVKSTKTGTYCIALRSSGQDRSYVAEYTINSPNIWELKTITIRFDYAGGTWNYTTGIGLNIYWSLAAGTGWHTTAGTWQTGNYLATANQVNACDSTDNDFQLAKVKFEPGQVATPFVSPDFATELMRCLRYTFSLEQSLSVRMAGYAANTIDFPLRLSPPMRGTPALVSGTEGTDWGVYTTAGAVQSGFALSIVNIGPDGSCCTIRATKTAHGLTDGFLKFLTTLTNRLNAEL